MNCKNCEEEVTQEELFEGVCDQCHGEANTFG